MYEIDQYRQTGRSTRMLHEAMRLSKERRAVYVVADNLNHVKVLEGVLAAMYPNEVHHGIKIDTPELLGKFDWWTLRVERAHPNCVFLVDHYCIERRFAPLLNMLHQFDPEDDGYAFERDIAND
jgi:hypothetical protein